MIVRLGARRALVFLVLVAALAAPSAAQIPGLRGALGRAAGRVAGQAVAERIGYADLLRRDPITTALPDARWAAPAFALPRDAGPARPLASLRRGDGGAFVLQPGLYEMHVQSYCLRAGTHGPGRGDGYLYAPPLGPADEVVIAILQNSVRRPDIAQSDIQQLLWAIVARARVEDLSARLGAVAAALLTTRQLATLNRDALSAGVELAMQGAPPLVRQTLEAEQRLRSLLTDGGSFAEMEAAAVLTGAARIGPGSRDVPAGQWSAHPDGYHVRYTPQGYKHTVVQVYVEPRGRGVGRLFDPATHIAVPGNTSQQRLAQSARPYGD